MYVRVKYLLWLREKTGVDQEEYVLSDNATMEDLLRIIMDKHQELEKLLSNPFDPESRILITINGYPAKPGARLREKDTVIIMPTVSGG